jgi:hypothetical protein
MKGIALKKGGIRVLLWFLILKAPVFSDNQTQLEPEIYM